MERQGAAGAGAGPAALGPAAGPRAPRPGRRFRAARTGKGTGGTPREPTAPARRPSPAPIGHPLPTPRGHLFRPAQRRRCPCGCRRQLLAPPWCSDDAFGEPLRPLPRLCSRRPPPPGPAAQTGERRQGRAEGAGRRDRARERGRAGVAWARARPLAGRCGVAAARMDATGSPLQEQRQSQAPEPGASGHCRRPLSALRGLERGRRRLVALGAGTGTVQVSTQVRRGHRDALLPSELCSSQISSEVNGDSAKQYDATWKAKVRGLSSTLVSGLGLSFRTPLLVTDLFTRPLFLMSPRAYELVKLVPNDVAFLIPDFRLVTTL